MMGDTLERLSSCLSSCLRSRIRNIKLKRNLVDDLNLICKKKKEFYFNYSSGVGNKSYG